MRSHGVANVEQGRALHRQPPDQAELGHINTQQVRPVTTVNPVCDHSKPFLQPL